VSASSDPQRTIACLEDSLDNMARIEAYVAGFGQDTLARHGTDYGETLSSDVWEGFVRRRTGLTISHRP
jgi:hypothetical protein